MNNRCTDGKQYREAARQIAQGDHDCGDGRTQGACDVLGRFRYMNRPDLEAVFKEYFVIGEGYYLIEGVCDSLDEARNVRVLALCFMAAMVEAGDA